jgi:hypothetical protein
MCWVLKKKKKTNFIHSDFLNLTNLIVNTLFFKKIEYVSSAIAYKNRFLLGKRSSKFQFIGLFLNKGYKIRTLKLINTVYLSFLHKYHGLTVIDAFSKYITIDNNEMGEFINLYNSFTLFKDWSRALIWRIEENLPVVKVISKKIKKKKKKKKKRKMYTLEYKYIKKKYRFQTALRLLSLLVKIYSKKLIIGFFKVFIPFLINPSSSKFIYLKKKIYTGLLLSL